MKEDTQLICPIGYEDKNEVWPIIQKFVCDRLPLKDVTWRSNISSSFVNIEKLPLRFLPASAKLFNETMHPYRRFLGPYVHMYLLCAESMDVYKAAKSAIKKWVEQCNSNKAYKQSWLIVYVPLGTSTMDVYNKVNARLASDFYADKSGDRTVMLTIPPESKRPNASAQERLNQQSLLQQSYAAMADLLGKLRDGVITTFQQRLMWYDADIRKLDIQRGTPTFDFWQLFLVKESLALMFQMMQMPDRALSLYDELEVLLPFAPYHSLPQNDWPMVVPAPSKDSSNSGGGGGGAGSAGRSGGSNSPSRDNNRSGASRDASPAQGDRRAPSEDSVNTPTKASSGSRAKKDLMSDACRSGEDIIVYSINQARMNILWNRFSFFQLQHYVFARQMYFLLVHLRQPTRCAEKALGYMRTATIQVEQRLQRQYGTPSGGEGGDSSGTAEGSSNTEGGGASEAVAKGLDEESSKETKLLQLRRAQADVWALMASLKLIRECRALLQLLVGGDAAYNSIFGPSAVAGGSAAAGESKGPGAVNSMSYSHTSGSGGLSGMHEALQDNLAAISSASTHGSSVVYSSLAELSKSQHGIAHAGSAQLRRVSTDLSSPLSATGVLSPAATLREVLFSPQLDITAELRDSSRVLGDLIEFALYRLHALSSSTVKQAGYKALQLTLSVEPFSTERYLAARVEEAGALSEGTTGSRRTVTVTKVSTGADAALGSLTSPKNVDIVLTIEQELALLDEAKDGDTVASVGERMDQILLSISQKVRSTSHFWAKLYEASTPALLLDPSLHGGAIGSGTVPEGVAAGGEPFEAVSPGSSPCTSRVGTPISSPAPSGPSSTASASGPLRSLRKVISRHSSRNLVVSRSQMERGRLLELCLSVLGCSAQWHLHLLANRPRFALSAMLRGADLLICNNQLSAAAKRLEEALRSGLLAPVTAYICNSRPVGLFPSTVASGSQLGGKLGSVFLKCLPDAQLHQQQEPQHRALNFTAAEVGEYVQAHPLHGAYAQLWHWTLRKLLYCLQKERDWERYRMVLANLLIPLSPDGVARIPLEPPSLLEDLLREFIALSTLPTEPTTTAVDRSSVQPALPEAPVVSSFELNSEDTSAASRSPLPPPPSDGDDASNQDLAAAPASPLTLPTLHLPLGSYFDLQLGMVRPRVGDAEGWAPRLVKGYEVVREEWLPVSSMQCEGGREGGYCLPIVLVNYLPGFVPVNALGIVYKRFCAETIISQTLAAREGDKVHHHRCVSSAGSHSALAVAEDEFVCQPLSLMVGGNGGTGAGAAFMLEPGAHPLCMAFQPSSLGDYRLDRIVMVVGTAVFESHLLPEVPVSDVVTSPPLQGFPAAGHPLQSVQGEAQLASALYRDEILTSPGLVGLALLDDLDSAAQLGRDERETNGARVFSAGESAALTALKAYFQRHRIIQVLPPDDLLSLCGTVAPSVPVMQTDDAYFTAETRNGDEVSELQITVSGQSRSGMSACNSLSSRRALEEVKHLSAGSSCRTVHGATASAANALKLAQGKSPVGFVPEDQATPAAMRRRRADPLDQDEAEAMASAAAAVANLLALQASDSQRSNRSGGHMDGGFDSELQLAVSELGQWSALTTSIGGEEARYQLLLPAAVATDPQSDDAVTRHATLKGVPGNARLHLRLPFTVHAVNPSPGEELVGDVVLSVEVTGTLRRAGCLIPLKVAAEVVVRVRTPLTLQVTAHHPCQHSAGLGPQNSSREVVLQANICNNTEGTLELTGYRLLPTTISPGSSSDPSLAMTVVDGPTELPMLSQASSSSGRLSPSGRGDPASSVVSLQPSERYFAGLCVRVPVSAVNSRLEFHFQRTPSALYNQVNPGIYRHRVFSVGHVLSGSADAAASAVDALCMTDPVVDGSRGVHIAADVVPGPSAVRLGRIHSCTYTLVVRLPGGGLTGEVLPSGADQAARYCFSDVDNSVADAQLTLSEIPQGSLSSLVVSLCETDAWMVVGRATRALHRCALTSEHATPSSGGSIELSYTLVWQLLPVQLGAQPLPPLKVEYGLTAAVDLDSSEARHEELVHPSKLQGHDVVRVVPAVVAPVGSVGSGGAWKGPGGAGGSAAAVQTLLRTHLLPCM